MRFTDTEGYFVSEASVYRLLKARDLIVPAGTRHPFSMSFAASATMTSYASRSVLSLMQAALDAVPLLAAAPGVAASIAGTLAAWC